MTMSSAQTVSSITSESPPQSALWSTLTSAVSLPYKIYNGTRVFFQECKILFDMKEPYFILHTELSTEMASIRLAGELCTDNPCIQYYHFPRNLYPERNKHHFLRFMLEDGTTLERNEYCKAWAVTKQAVIFLEGIQVSLKAWENPAEPKYEGETLRVGAMLKKWKAYLAELTFSMHTLRIWEIEHRVPEKWAAMPAYDYDNPHIFPFKTINSAGEKETRRLTPLFIPLSKHVIKLHEEGFDEEWFDLWDRLKPDPEKFAPYHLPLDRPWPYKDIGLRKKTGEIRE
ncbi:Hypothetical Protein CGB_F6140W [Cryptococcus gattii WM276]|uniref:Uncharacterized protein n=1 Tax=Cryptococcus gattii serotype B (strain WM276 / ATCC MYA-4071) TaxID=367775 RepID=E6R8P8_CRYGW|nr:Hypothetical Protein CGB_F6140W [Cryptococcus gattii WM276]ADV23159.1 Hypothetical Protein CGB_F6140W [Cryptococcus gattii WM276]